MKKKKNPLYLHREGIPPLVLIGAVAVLFPIFTYLTIENIQRQKEQNIKLLIEKSAALIRSFEAGTRTGMMGIQWSSRKLQNLITETAMQPDIKYILVTDSKGVIIAHNNPTKIGQRHGQNLALNKVVQTKKLIWRISQESTDQKLFEVFRKFTPTIRPNGRAFFPFMRQSSKNNSINSRRNRHFDQTIIFLGLDMSSLEAARIADTWNSIIMATILLFIGFAGFILVFLAQRYRTTKTSLSRMKILSGTIVDNMPIGLIVVSKDGKVVSFNHAAESILGLSSTSNIIGKQANDTIPKELFDIQREVKNNEIAPEREIHCTTQNGDIIPIEAAPAAIKDENENPLGTIILFKDLSEINRLRVEIANNQRLASIGSLAAGVAHEIRNPLSSIKGFATYFKENTKNVPQNIKIADIMIQEVNRLNKVVGQLLDFAKPVKVTSHPSQLQAVIRQSLQLVEKDAEKKNIRILTFLPDDIPMVSIDGDLMTQVMLNLYLNAIEATQETGQLEIKLKQKHNSVEIQVCDDGPGIAHTDLPHIFDPYFTTKKSGTGLGLAIVHNIIEAHKGTIKAVSQPDVGTTMSITLPLGRESTNR